MQTTENLIHLSHTWPEIWAKICCQQEKRKTDDFVADFSDFYLAVNASKHDAKMKTEFIYHTHDTRYGPKYAASSKNEKLTCRRFFWFLSGCKRI